jgi:hypothetical protein
MITVFGVVMGYGTSEKKFVRPKAKNFIVCKRCAKKTFVSPSRMARAKFCSGECREEFKRSGKLR